MLNSSSQWRFHYVYEWVNWSLKTFNNPLQNLPTSFVCFAKKLMVVVDVLLFDSQKLKLIFFPNQRSLGYPRFIRCTLASTQTLDGQMKNCWISYPISATFNKQGCIYLADKWLFKHVISFYTFILPFKLYRFNIIEYCLYV